MKIAVLGGTGKLGMGFVARLQATGHTVAVGSRDLQKAQAAATEAGGGLLPMTNLDAATWCDLAILTVPYAAHRTTIEPLSRKSTRLNSSHRT